MSNNGFQGFSQGIPSGPSMTLLQKQVVTQSVLPQFDFANIPSNYTDLLVRGVLRTDFTATSSLVGVQFNGDNGNNYNTVTLYATAGAVSEGGPLASTSSQGFGAPAAQAPAGTSSPFEMLIPYYAGNIFNKTFRVHSATRSGTGGTGFRLDTSVGEWMSSAPVNRVTVFPFTGNFVVGCELALWGVL